MSSEIMKETFKKNAGIFIKLGQLVASVSFQIFIEFSDFPKTNFSLSNLA